MKYKDYYQALGVSRDVSDGDIKQAYRKLARKFHPDVTRDPQGEEKFKEVAEAYATLKDPEKRREYDRLGQRRNGEEFSPPPDWQSKYGAGATGFDNVDLSDLFAAFTQGPARSHGPRRTQTAHRSQQRGQDYEVVAPVTLEQVYRGSETDIRIDLPAVDRPGQLTDAPRVFRIMIPAGAADGQRLRLAGKGGPGRHGGKPGDLYVVLALQPHPLYRIDGRDLYLDLPLAPWEAALGAVVQAPTPAGKVALTITPGTSSGQRLRLTGRGLPAADGATGDLYAVVQIVVPKKLTDIERTLYAQMPAASGFDPRKHFQAPQ
jgi:curved DNA-binding protein